MAGPVILVASADPRTAPGSADAVGGYMGHLRSTAEAGNLANYPASYLSRDVQVRLGFQDPAGWLM